ncbi:hypothetical protein BJ912DRAFT_1110755 [Pholiota molesta]|nr:hypothetical protein BJ912DRAFT_1110755 [Pholiota molesta]
MSTREAERNSSAQQTLDILYDISQLLNTQLDKATLATCIGMVENGVNPEALAAVIQELRREGAATQPPRPAKFVGHVVLNAGHHHHTSSRHSALASSVCMAARPLQPSEYEIQREVEVLRDLRRRSTTPGALTIDPDLPNQSPPASPTAHWPGKPLSTSPISATDSSSSSSFAQGSSSLEHSTSSSSSSSSRAPATDGPNNPADDPLHLFWVPASLHPEIAPAEFRAFLKEHARSPVDASDPASVSSSTLLSASPSLSRKKSMLSRQYRPKENDGVENENIVPLKRNRSLLYPTNPGPQLTISDLQMLEELAEEASTSDDPSKLRNVLRRSLSLNVSPSAVEMMDEMPEMGDEADAPIIVPPPGQILRRAARTKIRKSGLPGDGGGHRFAASRRGGQAKPSQAPTAEQRTSSEISSSDHGDADSSIVRRPTISDDGSQGMHRPSSSYSEENSIYDAYARDDDEDTTPLVVTPATPQEPLPLEEPPVPQPPPPIPPVLHQPQPQRLNVPPSQDQTPPSRTPSPSEPVAERPTITPLQATPSVPAPQPPPQSRQSVAPTPAPAVSIGAPNRKEKEKKSLFKWGDKGGKKGSKEKDRESHERAEKEKESGFFGSLFGGKKKQDSDYQSSMTGGTSGREAAQALLGASKSSKSYVPPTSPGLAPGIGGNPYARYPIHVERAIYRLSHIKLANPRRPLYEQVLISNLMFWYLGVINKAQNPTPASPTQPTAPNGQQQPNSGAAGGGGATEQSRSEQEEREEREREQREKEAREKAEKERLEREQREREMEQKKKESGRRGSLTKAPPAGGAPGGRRAAEMPIKGPQYEMQHRVMEQEYGQVGGMYNGGGPPRSPTSATTNGGPPQGYQRPPQPGPYNGAGGGPPRGQPEQQYYYQSAVDPHPQGHMGLPPGAMPPVEPTGSWNGQPPQLQQQQRTSPPPAQQRRLSPNQGGQRRSQSPPAHHNPHHNPHGAQKQGLAQQLHKLNTSQESLTLGPDGTRRAPARSLSATAYSSPAAGLPAVKGGAPLRKGNSAHAASAAPYDRARERKPSTSERRSPGGEEEDVPLAVWQQQRRK